MQYKSYCAANSGDGFVSFFDTLIDEKNSKVYYIKGGPGCGKSTLLKRIAAKSNNAELIYCSGDPKSLDGVVLPDQKVVIFDATAPHNFEPKYPGVGGNIIDLGQGWDEAKMNKNKIIHLCDRKSEIYKSCYSLLGATKKLYTSVFLPLKNQLDVNRLQNLGDRILKQYGLWEKREGNPKISKRFFTSISPEGRITLNETINSLSKHTIMIEDRWMIGHFLMEYWDRALTQNGIDHINGYNPLLGKESIQHIIIPSTKLSFVVVDGIFPLDLSDEQIDRKIILQNYIPKEFMDNRRNKLSLIKKMIRSQLDLASEMLNNAREIHMKIESEYAIGTDYEATECLKEKLINHLFSSP